jgi:hypothetical protein
MFSLSYVFLHVFYTGTDDDRGEGQATICLSTSQTADGEVWDFWKQFKGHGSPRAKYAGWIDCTMMAMVQAGMSAQRV